MNEPVLGRLLPFTYHPKPNENLLITIIGWTLMGVFNGVYIGTLAAIVALALKAVL